MLRAFVLLVLLTLGFSVHLSAEDASPQRLTLDRIYQSGELNERPYSCQWLPGDASAYTRLESEDESDRKAIVRYDAATGEKETLVSSADLTPPGQATPLAVESYAWSSDLARVLIYTESKKVWRRNTRGDYWVLDRGSRQLMKLGGDAEPSSLMFAKFSPTGDHVGYVREGNLFVQDLTDGSIKQLTSRKNDRIINGTSDWVYEEEFGLRDGFRWSPDGKDIAFWRFDTATVQDFTLINNTDGLYPTVKRFAYPKVGTRNSIVRIGVVDVETSETRWLPVVGDPQDSYIPRIQWIEKTGELIVREMNRLQNTEQIHLLNFDTDTHRVLHTEQDEAWIDLQDELYFSHDAEWFFYLSDEQGWRHLRSLSVFGDDRWEPMSGESYDVIELASVVTGVGKDTVYFIASPDSATDRYLFSVDTETKKVRRITPDDQPGTHSYQVSPRGDFAIHQWSDADTPTKTELVSLPDHATIRSLEDNAKLAESIAALDRSDTEFLRIDIGDVQLDAMCMKPANLDPEQKIPADRLCLR